MAETVQRSRSEAELVLEDNPSLGQEVPKLARVMFEKFARFPVDEFIRRRELEKSRRSEILGRPYTADQVLGEWIPDEPTDSLHHRGRLPPRLP
jgi:hypothetical protein